MCPQPVLPQVCSWHLVINLWALETQWGTFLYPWILAGPTFGDKDPVPGLARAVKGLGSSDDVQTMNSYSAPSIMLWCVTYQSPANYTKVMTAPSEAVHLSAFFTLRVALSPWLKAENLLLLSSDWLMASSKIEAGGSYCLCDWHSPHSDRSSSCPEWRVQRWVSSCCKGIWCLCPVK